MKHITLSETRILRFEHFRTASTMYSEIPYLLNERDTECIPATIIRTLPGTDALQGKTYKGESLEGKSLLYFASGDRQDVLLGLLYVFGLANSYKDAVIDVAGDIETYLLYECLGFRGGWHAYPVVSDFAYEYDYLLFSNKTCDRTLFYPSGIDPEGNDKKGETSKGKCLPLTGSRHNAPGPLCFSDRPTIAIHVDAEKELCGYPIELWAELLKIIEDREKRWRVVVTGCDRTYREYFSFSPSPVFFKEITALETISILSQADLIVSADSSAAAAGGILKIPTLVIQGPRIMDIYGACNSIRTIQAKPPCVPCQRERSCPLGYLSCQAMSNLSLSPMSLYGQIGPICKSIEAIKGEQ